MLKETHPEYDPHEPMITSAFSEEDLRKSREDVYDDYKNEITNYSEVDYDPSKSFSINTSIMPTDTYLPKQDKAPGKYYFGVVSDVTFTKIILLFTFLLQK